MYFVYVILTVGLFVLAVIIAKSDIFFMIDAPSFVILMGPTILMLLSHYSPNEFINAFKAAMAKNSASEVDLKNALLFFSTAQTLLIASTVVAVFLGIIMILGAVWKGSDNSARVLSGWMAVDFISILYLAFGMLFVTVPFKSAVQKKLNDIQS
jgi:flagellar motor component MotA